MTALTPRIGSDVAGLTAQFNLILLLPKFHPMVLKNDDLY